MPAAAPANPWAFDAAAPVAVFEAEAASANNKLYVFGGFYNSKIQVTSSAEVFDPAANAWQSLGNTPAPQTHVGTATDGRTIYFAGGFRGNWYGQPSSDFWEYDTTANTWTRGPSLPAARGAGGLVLLGRQLHFFGGAYGDTVSAVEDSSDHWVLDLDNPSAGWVAKAPLPDPRNHLGYAVLNGKIYAIGGQHQLNESAGLDATVSVYDPATDTWSSAAPLPAPRSHLHNSTFVYEGRIICAGGTDTGDVASNQVLAYDPAADQWSVVGALPAARSAAVAQVVGDEIVVATGTPTGVLPQTNTWARSLDFLQASSSPGQFQAVPVPGAPAAAGGLTVRVAAASPAAVVVGATGGGGTKGAKGAQGVAGVRINNAGKNRVAEGVAVKVYLVPDPAADPANDPDAVAVASVSRRLALRGGQGKMLRIVFRYPASLAAGSYYVEAATTPAPAGSASDPPAAVAVGAKTLSVAAPSVDLAAAFAPPAPAGLSPGRRVTASLDVKNNGNVPSAGPLRIALSAVDGGAAAPPRPRRQRRS